MSDRLTEISSGPGTPGLQEWGRKTRAEMIDAYRVYYGQQLLEAKYALSLSDEALVVETFIGPHVQRNREVVP